MSRVRIITHQGHDIIFSDLSNIEDGQEILDAFDEVERLVEQRTEPFCTLYNITGSYLDSQIIDRAKALSKYVDSTSLSRGSATVGVDSHSKRIIGNFLKPSMYFAKDMDDALANLTKKKYEAGE